MGLLDPEPSAEERAFVAALDAADLAVWNAPEVPNLFAVTEGLAAQARSAEGLTRRVQAAMLRQVHALSVQVGIEDAGYAGGIRHQAGEFTADEVAIAMGLPRHTARERIDDAHALVECCPTTLACLQAGMLSYQAASLLARETAFAPDGQQQAAEAMVLDRLAGPDLPGLGSMTPEQIERVAVLDPQACWRVAAGASPARVRRVARRVLADLDADRPARRRRAQAGPSDITVYPTRPGWMLVGVEMPEADGCTAQARIHAHALLLKKLPGETRHLGQLRVQALRDLLFGHTPHPGHGPDGPDHGGPAGRPDGGGPGGGPSPYDGLVDHHLGEPVCPPAGLPMPVPFDVHLTLDATGHTADTRYGLLSPGTLQAILQAARGAGGTIHVRTITPKPCPGDHPDPEQLAVDPDPRFPNRTLATTIRMRDQTCRFPGCTIHAGRADLDHSIPWPHGPTCVCNLCCLCRHHHRLKTHGRWKVTNHGNGHLTWTTPTGRTIHVRPDR